jgi:hypothetical protein
VRRSAEVRRGYDDDDPCAWDAGHRDDHQERRHQDDRRDHQHQDRQDDHQDAPREQAFRDACRGAAGWAYLSKKSGDVRRAEAELACPSTRSEDAAASERVPQARLDLQLRGPSVPLVQPVPRPQELAQPVPRPQEQEQARARA